MEELQLESKIKSRSDFGELKEKIESEKISSFFSIKSEKMEKRKQEKIGEAGGETAEVERDY